MTKSATDDARADARCGLSPSPALLSRARWLLDLLDQVPRDDIRALTGGGVILRAADDLRAGLVDNAGPANTIPALQTPQAERKDETRSHGPSKKRSL